LGNGSFKIFGEPKWLLYGIVVKPRFVTFIYISEATPKQHPCDYPNLWIFKQAKRKYKLSVSFTHRF